MRHMDRREAALEKEKMQSVEQANINFLIDEIDAVVKSLCAKGKTWNIDYERVHKADEESLRFILEELRGLDK